MYGVDCVGTGGELLTGVMNLPLLYGFMVLVYGLSFIVCVCVFDAFDFPW